MLGLDVIINGVKLITVPFTYLSDMLIIKERLGVKN